MSRRITKFHKNNVRLLLLTSIAIVVSCVFFSGTQETTKSTPVSTEEEILPFQVETAVNTPTNVEIATNYKIINTVTAESYFVVIDPVDRTNPNSLKYVIKELCSTKEFCRINFYVDSEMSEMVAYYHETNTSKVFQLYLLEVHNDNALQSVNQNIEYEPIKYSVTKEYIREYYFVLMSLSDASKLSSIGAEKERLSFGRSVCKTNKDYCYVFVWDNELLVPKNTFMNNEQAKAIKVIYRIRDTEEYNQLCIDEDWCLARYSIEPEMSTTYNQSWVNP